MYKSARMMTRWAPFVNRRRPLVDEPSGAAKWSPPPPQSSGGVRRAPTGFPRFIGSVSLGSPTLLPLPILIGVLGRPKELAQHAGEGRRRAAPRSRPIGGQRVSCASLAMPSSGGSAPARAASPLAAASRPSYPSSRAPSVLLSIGPSRDLSVRTYGCTGEAGGDGS